jgi:hypothetical protein
LSKQRIGRVAEPRGGYIENTDAARCAGTTPAFRRWSSYQISPEYTSELPQIAAKKAGKRAPAAGSAAAHGARWPGLYFGKHWETFGFVLGAAASCRPSRVAGKSSRAALNDDYYVLR